MSETLDLGTLSYTVSLESEDFSTGMDKISKYLQGLQENTSDTNKENANFNNGIKTLISSFQSMGADFENLDEKLRKWTEDNRENVSQMELSSNAIEKNKAKMSELEAQYKKPGDGSKSSKKSSTNTNNFEKVKSSISSMVKSIEDADDKVEKFKTSISNLAKTPEDIIDGIQKFKDEFSKLKDLLNIKSGSKKNFASEVTPDLKLLTTNMDKTGQKGKKVMETLKNAGEALGRTVSKAMFGPWEMLEKGLKKLPKSIKDISFKNMKKEIEDVAKDFGSKFKKPLNRLKEFKNKFTFKEIEKNIKKLPDMFNKLMKDITKNLLSSLTKIKGLFKPQNIKKVLGFIKNPWMALVLLIIASIGAIIANWDKISKWVKKNFGGKGSIPKNFKDFQKLFQKIWKSILQVFSKVWKQIEKVAADAWKYMSPTIIGGVNKIKAFWSQVWPEIKQVFVEVWNVMKVILAPTMIGIYMAISTALGLIKAIWRPAWNVLKDTLKTVWDAITGVIRVAWDVISGVIKVGLDLLTGNWSKAWEDFKSIFSNVWNDLGKLISNIGQDALKWGSDIIDGLIKGIKGAVGGLTSAVKDIANVIWSHLHFSVPEEGPLVDYESWMPDFMQGLANGINRNKKLVTNAVKGLAGDMKIGMQLTPEMAVMQTLNKVSADENSNKVTGTDGITFNFDHVTINGYSDLKKVMRDAYNIHQDYSRARGGI